MSYKFYYSSFIIFIFMIWLITIKLTFFEETTRKKIFVSMQEASALLSLGLLTSTLVQPIVAGVLLVPASPRDVFVLSKVRDSLAGGPFYLTVESSGKAGENWYNSLGVYSKTGEFHNNKTVWARHDGTSRIFLNQCQSSTYIVVINRANT